MKLSQRIAHERLTRICFIDYDREMALVADYKDPQTGEREIIAMGRLSRLYDRDEAEFALLVRDGFQRHGLRHRAAPPARRHWPRRAADRLTAVILPQNQGISRSQQARLPHPISWNPIT